MLNTEARVFEIARSLFRESNDAFFLFDPQTQQVADLNPTALRLTGLEKAAACSMRLDELFQSDSPEGFDRLREALRRTDFFHSREGYSLRRREGTPLPVNLSVSRIHTEPEPMGLVVARDLSEQKRSEEALRQIEERYNGLIASTGVIVWESDPQGVLLSLSSGFQDVTGWAPDDWIGRRLEELFPPRQREQVRRIGIQAEGGQTIPRLTVRTTRRSGADLDLEFLLVTPIRVSAGSRLMGIMRDVTEWRRLEATLEQTRALRRAKEAAEQASQAKNEFLANVSHEIRTPLTAILGFAELLAEHPYLAHAPAEVQDFLRTIHENGRYLVALVDDLLDLTCIETEGFRLDYETCAPRRIVCELLATFAPKARSKALKLTLEPSGPLPETIATDPLRLRQILASLLDNAIKYTATGEVRLAVRRLTSDCPEPALQFEVKDSGIGMSEEDLAGLFRPFQRAVPSTMGSQQEAGLSLAISQRLARRLGGEITARSAPGAGTSFTLTIPIRTFDPAPNSTSPTSSGSSQPGGTPVPPFPFRPLRARILLADDNDANQRVISLRLTGAGATVVTARNGLEALERAREARERGQPLDAVIMDMQMPVLDGYEAVRQLRAQGFTAPILAVTAYARNQDREECIRLGCDDFISKPIEWDRFFTKLTRLLPRPSNSGAEP